jgi:hypothetical protein
MSPRRLLAYSIPQYVFALLVALLRCWVRLKIVKSFGRDDWVMISALVRMAYWGLPQTGVLMD